MVEFSGDMLTRSELTEDPVKKTIQVKTKLLNLGCVQIPSHLNKSRSPRQPSRFPCRHHHLWRSFLAKPAVT